MEAGDIGAPKTVDRLIRITNGANERGTRPKAQGTRRTGGDGRTVEKVREARRSRQTRKRDTERAVNEHLEDGHLDRVGVLVFINKNPGEPFP